MSERPTISLAKRAFEIAVLTVPVTLAVMIGCLVFVGVKELFLLWFVIDESGKRITGGERLQAGANLIGAFFGSVLAGGAAILVHVMERRTSARERAKVARDTVRALFVADLPHFGPYSDALLLIAREIARAKSSAELPGEQYETIAYPEIDKSALTQLMGLAPQLYGAYVQAVQKRSSFFRLLADSRAKTSDLFPVMTKFRLITELEATWTTFRVLCSEIEAVDAIAFQGLTETHELLIKETRQMASAVIKPSLKLNP